MVEIFKTNVWDKWSANRLIGLLYSYFPDCRINFDLDDCDKILRIEGENVIREKVKLIINENGFICEILD